MPKFLALLIKLANLVFILFGLLLVITILIKTNSITELSFLGLFAVPFLTFYLFFSFLVLAVSRKMFVCNMVILLVVFLIAGPFYKFATKTDKEAHLNELSVITFNARGFNSFKALSENSTADSIYNFLIKENVDIVAMQEAAYYLKRQTVLDSIYPYKYVDFIYGEQHNRVLQAIFSKYPIKQIKLISFPNSSNLTHRFEVDFKGSLISIYNVHLQSFKVVPSLRTVKNEDSKSLISNINRKVLMQSSQVDILLADLATHKNPTLIMGDFNNTQYSNIYRSLSKGFKDTYIEAGAGFGRTYSLKGLPMRIDYILASPQFEVLSHTNYDVDYSDHYPVKATLLLKD